MKQLICKPRGGRVAALSAAAAAMDTAGAAALSYRRYVAASRARFFAQSAASSVDLLTLVVADALKRKTEAEHRHDVLRDALYERRAQRQRDDERSTRDDGFDDAERA